MRVLVISCFLISMFPVLADGAIPVTVKSIKELAVYPEITVPATVINLNDSKLSTGVKAVIQEIPVQVGDIVERGATLLRLDTKDYELVLQRAEAALASLVAKLDFADFQLQRAQKLSKQKAISEEVLKQREAELKSLQAEYHAQQVAVAMAKRDLDKCTLRSPFKAIVKERLGQVGELASPGMPVIHILDVEHIEVTAKVQASDIGLLRDAESVEFVNENKRYPLLLKSVTPAFDQMERSQEIRLAFTGNMALSGAAGTLVWRSKHPYLPPDMLVRRNNKIGVFVIDGQSARFVSMPEAQEGRPVINALSDQSRIIVDGRFTVRDGDQVKIK